MMLLALSKSSVFDVLTDFGVTPSAARKLAEVCSVEDVQGWIEYAKSAGNLTNPPGFVVNALRKGDPPPSPRQLRDDLGEYGFHVV
jgi:hypothetical protein